MALTTCKECGKDKSDTAETCPHCGYKAKKPTSRLTWLVTGAVVLVVAMSIGNKPPVAPTQTPEQLAAKQKQNEGFQKALAGAKMLKQTMRDPDSFKLVTAVTLEAGAVCYKYRAKNGFGGTNASNAVLTADNQFKSSDMDGFKKLWNKECANQSGPDQAKAVQRLL